MNRLPIVTDSQVDDSLSSLESLDVDPAEFPNWSAVEHIHVDSANIDNPPLQLTDSEFRLLKAIVDNPTLPSSHYVKLARISPNTLAKLRPIFIEKGLIREHMMDSANRGRSKRIWEPLELAKQAVANSQTTAGT